MTPQWLADIVSSSVNSTAELVRSQGQTTRPTLWAFRGQDIVGFLSTRQADRGHDGAVAVTNLSLLACASAASDVVITWDQNDLALLCGDVGFPIEGRGHALQIVVADRDKHYLLTHPYNVTEQPRPRRLLARRPPPSLDLSWGDVIKHPMDSPLPPVIDFTIQRCWEPVGALIGVHAAAAQLRSEGYDVTLAGGG